ncbi:U4/U6 small nuclear ribonucleoprotein Prp31 [Neocloeon triangulifer]|uniref:U4/U6 small nuclear ribonucleoprotein Prp31 n=1 Tax=Neocloeon triangulifer TaxID=2078957 RepID=UPI00286F22B7|nr:U4/U6 small nuclear ribonucleoprotein Prp31 [Neocloeon triangulifer]
MSLAEELLADLEEDQDMKEDEELKDMISASAVKSEVDRDSFMEDLSSTNQQKISLKTDSIRQLAKLRDSKRLNSIMEQIERFSKKPRTLAEMRSTGAGEADPEYQLIVEANNLAVDIENEIGTIYQFVKERYSRRFPELDSLVVQPLEFIKTVRELGNELENVKNNEALLQVLTQATIMVVSVTASTTQGHYLSEPELDAIQEACDMAIEVNNFKQKILEYVEARMAFIAPNLSAIVGASTAAKMMGLAGGLTRLANMPSCNIQVLGAQKKTLSGFSRVAALPHTGFVYYCELVQDTAPDLRIKAARLVAAKSALAARVDAGQESKDGTIGMNFRDEIEKKLDKLQEPAPVKFIKPLPKPVDPTKKRRGGKRVRKMKERYAVTEMRKQQNRMNFGDIEDDAYQNDLGYTRGTIGKSSTGRIRMPQVDEKTKVRISKTLQKNLQKQQQWGGSTTVRKQVSGTASSVAFTPMQGLEIVNPQAAERTGGEENAKYFSSTSGFHQAPKKP